MDDSQEDEQRPSKRARTAQSIGERPGREFGLMRRTLHENTAAFVGSGSGIHFVRAVYNAVANKRTDFEDPSPGNEAVPGEDDQLASAVIPASKSLWHSHEVGDASEAGSSVTFDELLTWSQSYWDHWHAAFPLLHAPTVLEWFEKISESGLEALESRPNKLILNVLRAVFSISLADRRQANDGSTSMRIPTFLVFNSYDAAVRSVQGALVDPPSILALQHAVSVQLFLVSMLRHNAASRIGGLVIRLIFHMGLHRCPLRYATFTVDEIALRKRIFWSTYCIDRHISQSLGLPLGIQDDDFDVCLLNEEKHATADSRTAVGQCPDERLATLDFLSKTFQLKGKILELCNKSINHRHTDPNAASNIIAEIGKLDNEIDDFLDSHSTNDSPIDELQLIVLKVLHNECLISLYRPLLTTDKTKSDYRVGLQVCIRASRSILTTLAERLLSRNDSHAACNAPLLWPSYTWAIWMSAFIIIYAAINGETPIAVAERFVGGQYPNLPIRVILIEYRLTEQSINILRHLSLRGSVWPSACAAAIRDLSGRLSHVSTRNESPSTVVSGNSQAKFQNLQPSKATFERQKSTSETPAHFRTQDSGFRSSSSVQSHLSDAARLASSENLTQVEPGSRVSGHHNGSSIGAPQKTQMHVGGDVPLGSAKQSLGSGPFQDPWPSFVDFSKAPMPSGVDVDLFDGFEIPFWMGHDEISAAWVEDWS